MQAGIICLVRHLDGSLLRILSLRSSPGHHEHLFHVRNAGRDPRSPAGQKRGGGGGGRDFSFGSGHSNFKPDLLDVRRKEGVMYVISFFAFGPRSAPPPTIRSGSPCTNSIPLKIFPLPRSRREEVGIKCLAVCFRPCPPLNSARCNLNIKWESVLPPNSSPSNGGKIYLRAFIESRLQLPLPLDANNGFLSPAGTGPRKSEPLLLPRAGEKLTTPRWRSKREEL